LIFGDGAGHLPRRPPHARPAGGFFPVHKTFPKYIGPPNWAGGPWRKGQGKKKKKNPGCLVPSKQGLPRGIPRPGAPGKKRAREIPKREPGKGERDVVLGFFGTEMKREDRSAVAGPFAGKIKNMGDPGSQGEGRVDFGGEKKTNEGGFPKWGGGAVARPLHPSFYWLPLTPTRRHKTRGIPGLKPNV